MDQEDNTRRGGRELALTLMLTLLFGGGFVLFMILVTGGFFMYVIGAVLAIGLVGGLHYLLWGHALTQEVAGEREEEELREQAARDEFLRDKFRARRF